MKRKEEIIDSFIQYCEQNGDEPNAAICLIEFRDDQAELEAVLKLNCECSEETDDNIFFYCQHCAELLSLVGKEFSSEDFYVKEVYEFTEI